MDLFINTSLNHMSTRSCLVSDPNNKLISNNEQLFNATDLLPIAFNSFYFQIHELKPLQLLKHIRELWIRTKIRKYVLSKYY